MIVVDKIEIMLEEEGAEQCAFYAPSLGDRRDKMSQEMA